MSNHVYTDTELEAMAGEFEAGFSDAELDEAVWVDGPMAWVLDVVGDDWEAFARKAREENMTPADLVRKAVQRYIHPDHAAA